MEIFAVVFLVLMTILGFAAAFDLIGADSRKQILDALCAKIERLFSRKKTRSKKNDS